MKEKPVTAGTGERPLRWPEDPENVTAADIDFTALAHVLANTCRRGGRTRRFYSIAQHTVVMSEEIDALDGLAPEERRVLALHALLSDAKTAWLGDAEAGGRAPVKAAERMKRDGAAIGRAVREAAGLDGEPDGEQADLLRFVARMADAAERRDLPGAGTDGRAAAVFPPLRRRIRPADPDRAARLWLTRCRELIQPPRETGGSAAAGNAHLIPTDEEKETSDVAHIPEKEGSEERAPRAGKNDEPRAA